MENPPPRKSKRLLPDGTWAPINRNPSRSVLLEGEGLDISAEVKRREVFEEIRRKIANNTATPGEKRAYEKLAADQGDYKGNP